MWNPTTQRYERMASTILDVTPFGDTVKEGVADKQDVALNDLLDDLNRLQTTGTTSVPDGVTLTGNGNVWSVLKAPTADYATTAGSAENITFGTDDLTPGTSPLDDGEIHLVYE